MRRGVQQHRADGQIDSDVDRPLERHIEGTVDLWRRPAEVHRDVAAGDGQRDGDAQILIRRVVQVGEAVDEPFRVVRAVRQLRDLLAEHALGIVHQVFAGRHDPVHTEALDQLHEARGADLAGCDLRFHVADHEVGRADVVAQHSPQGLVLDAFVVGLERQELKPFGVGILRIDDTAATGAQRPDIEMVRRGEGETDQAAAKEDGDAEADIRPMRGAVIRRIVDDHVARIELLAALLEEPEDAARISRDRPQLQRGRERRFAQLSSLRVQQRAAEIFRLTNDARVGHAGQLVPHLDGNALERPGNHAGCHGVDARPRPCRRHTSGGHWPSSSLYACGSA